MGANTGVHEMGKSATANPDFLEADQGASHIYQEAAHFLSFLQRRLRLRHDSWLSCLLMMQLKRQ